MKKTQIEINSRRNEELYAENKTITSHQNIEVIFSLKFDKQI